MDSVGWPIFMNAQHPVWLTVLLVLPLVVALSVRSLAGLGRTRGWVAIALRSLVITMLVLALAGPEWVRTTSDQTVTFAIDRSDSVPQLQQRQALAFVEQAAAGMRPDDRVAVVSFAADAVVDQLPHKTLVPGTGGMRGARHRSDLAAALRLGLAVFPPDTARRLVMISDGNENRGVAVEEAEAYTALDIPIDVLPLRYEHAAEILVERLAAPAAAERDEVVNLQLIARSQVATTARLRLYHNERLVDLDPATASTARAIELAPGPNRFSIPVKLQSSRVHHFRARIEPVRADTDAISVNNEGRAFTIVGGATRVLVVHDMSGSAPQGETTSAETLAAALQQGGIDCELIALRDLPADAAQLADTSAIILSNISALALGPNRQTMLASYVRDQGGGLLVLGGDRAFSVGGYAHTPLEEILPVETSRAKLNLLSLGLVLVIDRSGSMAGQKIVMARQAAIASVKLLSRLDHVGVVAFNSAAEWIVPLQRAENRGAILRQLVKLGGAGGTDMYPALEQASAALAGAETSLKHIILLTDGQSAPGAFMSLAETAGAAGITISAVAVGPDADRALLAQIADRSGGRMYIADSAQPLPQIFARETVLASRAGLYEQPFTPQLRPAVDERILVGLAPAEIPPLRGHVVTTAKPMAQVPLVRPTSDGADPILAYWQVGLGRVVAFTSGMWPQWGPAWVNWPGFSKVWTQAVRYLARPDSPGQLEVATTVQGGVARVGVSAEHLPLPAQASLTVTGQAISPGFDRIPLALHRTAAGRYEANFPLDAPGTYVVLLPYCYTSGGTAQAGVLRAGVAQAYSPEFRTLRPDETTLGELARRTGGRVLRLQQPEAVFEPWSVRPVRVRRPFWDVLVRLALLLFLMDVAVRRIAVTPAQVAGRLRAFIGGLVSQRSGDEAATTLGALRGAKARAQESAFQHERDAGPTPAEPRRARPPADRRHTPGPNAPDAAGPAEPTGAPPSEAPRPHAPASDDEYAARLLRAKRRVRRPDAAGDDPAGDDAP